MSELGLILELDSRYYLHFSSDLERCCRFPHITRAVGELRSSCAQKTIQKHEGAFGCCIERSEIV
eukprot:2017767-Pyramimonas_sp.AAC.1